MKPLLTSIIMFVASSVFAMQCIEDTPSGYKVVLPDSVADATLNGDKVAYCIKFKIDPEKFSRWLLRCGLEMDSLHDGKDILELELKEGYLTLIDTKKDDIVYMEVINTKNILEAEGHIGVHRECNL